MTRRCVVTSFGPISAATRESDTAAFQARAESFHAAGFEVISLNRAAEIPLLAGIRSVTIKPAPEGGVFPGRFGPTIAGMMAAAPEDCDVVGIVNADLTLLRSNLVEVLDGHPDTIIAAKRVNRNAGTGHLLGVQHGGYDGFFFRPRHRTLFAGTESELQLGVPTWDHAALLLASFDHDVRIADMPLFLHDDHVVRRSKDVNRISRQAMACAILSALEARRNCPAQAALLADCLQKVGIGKPQTDSAYAQKLARYFSARARQLDRRAISVHLDLGDPLLRDPLMRVITEGMVPLSPGRASTFARLAEEWRAIRDTLRRRRRNRRAVEPR